MRSLLVSELSAASMKELKTFENSNWRLFNASSKFLDWVAWAGCEVLLLILVRRQFSFRARHSERVTSIWAPARRKTDARRSSMRLSTAFIDDCWDSNDECRHAGQNHSAPGKSRMPLNWLEDNPTHFKWKPFLQLAHEILLLLDEPVIQWDAEHFFDIFPDWMVDQCN